MTQKSLSETPPIFRKVSRKWRISTRIITNYSCRTKAWFGTAIWLRPSNCRIFSSMPCKPLLQQRLGRWVFFRCNWAFKYVEGKKWPTILGITWCPRSWRFPHPYRRIWLQQALGRSEEEATRGNVLFAIALRLFFSHMLHMIKSDFVRTPISAFLHSFASVLVHSTSDPLFWSLGPHCLKMYRATAAHIALRTRKKMRRGKSEPPSLHLHSELTRAGCSPLGEI